jgi:hypothetical protein
MRGALDAAKGYCAKGRDAVENDADERRSEQAERRQQDEAADAGADGRSKRIRRIQFRGCTLRTTSVCLSESHNSHRKARAHRGSRQRNEQDGDGQTCGAKHQSAGSVRVRPGEQRPHRVERQRNQQREGRDRDFESRVEPQRPVAAQAAADAPTTPRPDCETAHERREHGADRRRRMPR